MRRLLALAFSSVALGCGGNGGLLPDGGVDSGAATPSHAPFPTIPQIGQQLLKPVKVVTVLAANDDLAAQLAAFGDAVVTSQWYTTVGADYGLGPAGPAVRVDGPALPAGTLSTSDAVAYVQAAVDAASPSPQPDGRTLYLLYLPAGVVGATSQGANTNCRFFAGFHAPLGADGFAEVQRCPVSRTTQLEQLTTTASHEIVEAASDNGDGWALTLAPGLEPWQATPWVEMEGSGRLEVADPCEGTRVTEGNFVYTRVLSNTAVAAGGDPCVPVIQPPYYNVTEPSGWYTGAPGSTVTITLTGWSTGTLEDWAVAPVRVTPSNPSLHFVANVAGITVEAVGTAPAMVNAGQTATLNVAVPPDAKSGDWATVIVESQRAMITAADDLAHLWVVGVHVP